MIGSPINPMYCLCCLYDENFALFLMFCDVYLCNFKARRLSSISQSSSYRHYQPFRFLSVISQTSLTLNNIPPSNKNIAKNMTDTTNGDAAATQSASIYSLPAELLDMILNLRPELAYTCKYLYDLNLKNELATVRGPGCKIAGVRNFTFKENPVRLISSFNSRLRRMRSHPGADYVR